MNKKGCLALFWSEWYNVAEYEENKMTKKTLILISFIVLIGSFILINKFQDKNFTAFNNVNPQRID